MSINQPRALALAIMTLQTSQSLVGFTVSVTHPTQSHLFPTSFLAIFFQSFMFSQDLPLSLFLYQWPKKAARHFKILNMSDPVVFVSPSTVSFDTFVVNEIRSMALKTH